MSISIRMRTLIAMNLLVVTAAIVLGWMSGQIAGDVVKERLVREVARNTARFVHERHLPFSDALMNSLSEMFGMNFATIRLSDGRVLGSSLPPQAADELQSQIARIGSKGAVVLDERNYLVESHQISRKNPRTGLNEQLQLCALASHEQFQDARDKTFDRIAGLGIPAVLAASILAVGLSLTITNPIGKLAGEMDRLAEGETDESAREGHRAAFRKYGSGGPTEIASLTASFGHLLERLDEARSQLARSERLAALGRIAAGVAHELRNPLSGIKMNVRVLKDELADRGVTDGSADLILREIDRMDLYLKELMGLSSANTDNAGPVDLGELVRSAVSLMSGRCKHAGIEIRFEDQTSAATINADGDQIRQVIINLIVNAIEAMPGGGGITLQVETSEAGEVRLWVRDTGPGVQTDEGSDVFELFTSTKGDNAGMGLYISKRIIAANGGRIGYEDSDSGAAFWFELPGA